MKHTSLAFAVALPLTTLVLQASAQTAGGQPAAVPAALTGPAMNNDPTPLPTSEALLTGELPSGVRYIIRQHAQPKDRAAVWMRVGTGSLNETDRQRGMAHFLEHMAFNGSTNFPPGTVIKLFESLGLTFGKHQNAFTSFDQTAYQLFIDNNPENLDKALLFMSDVAFRLLLDEKEIDAERTVILNEKRSRQSPQQRVQEAVLKRIMPGSIIGDRLPIGTEETITGMTPQDFKDYWGKWYTPTNLTVIVVADIDPQQVRAAIEKHFAGEPRRATPNAMETGVRPFTAESAVIVTDPELKRAEVGMLKIGQPPAPTTTVGRYRADLVETVGTWAFNRRLAAKREAGNVAFTSASAGSEVLFRAARLTQAEVSSEPNQWRDAFAQMATELQRARLHGFNQQELDDARAELLSQAELAVSRESTTEARALITGYNNQVADGEPIMSAAQRADLLKRLLPTITVKEVSEKFAADFDPVNVMIVAQLPEGADSSLTEADLLRAGKEALSVKPAAEAAAARVTSLLPAVPAGGKALEPATHAATGVNTFWLPSGVRVNHKFIDTTKDAVTVSIALANGAINENAETRGLSEAAALAFSRPATTRFTSTQVREFLTGKKTNVSGGAGDDTFTISVSGSPADLETGLQVAHVLLTDPKVEPAAIELWKTNQLQMIAMRGTQPGGVMQEMIPDAIFPKEEVRRRPLNSEQVQRTTAEAAQNWLKNVIATSPIEVTVVGDITLDKVQPLLETYLGSIPQRQRISSSTLDDRRAIARQPGPRTAERTVKTKTDQAIVLGGFFGPDAENVADVRAMNLASQIISSRMIQTIREEKQLVYSIGAQSQPGVVYPGYGIFVAGAPTSKDKAAELGDAIAAEYARFAATGPTEEELVTAKKQLIHDLEENLKKANWWAGVLSGSTYRNRNLDDLANARAAIEAFTPQQVKETFARYATPDNTLRFTVLPDLTPGK